MENSSDLSNDGLDEDLDEAESVSEQSDGLTWPSNSSFTSLADNEDRTSYLNRQGLSAILEREDQENQGLVYQEQQHPEYTPQIERLEREARHHIKILDRYCIQAPLLNIRELAGYSPHERTVGVKQVERSLDWLEMIDPEAGSSYREQVNSNSQYEIDKAELAYFEAVTENQETDLTSSESNQRYQQQQPSTLENLHCTVSCTAYKAWGPIRVALSPQIHLGGESKPSIHLGLDVNFNQFNTNRKGGVEISASARKGGCEVGVESNLSKNGMKHGYTAKFDRPSGLNAGVQVQSNNFKQMLHPTTLVENGQLFAGRTLKRGHLKGSVRFSTLPIKNLKEWVSSDFGQTGSNQNGIEFVLESQVDFSLNEVQSGEHHEDENKKETEKESIEQQEIAETVENREIATFAETKTSRQANQVELFTPPVSPPRGCVPTSSPFFNYLAIGLLFWGGAAAVFKLVNKFKTKD